MNKLMFRSGPAIQLIKDAQGDGEKGWIIPFFDETQFSTTQLLQKPVQKLFDSFQEVVMGTAGTLFGGTGQALWQGVGNLMDLFGVKLFQKQFFSQSWAGSEPMSFSVTLQFFRGMADEWNAKTEVYQPIIQILRRTVPNDEAGGGGQGAFMNSPVPSSLGVFSSFTVDIIESALNTATGAVGVLIGPLENKTSAFAASAKKLVNSLKKNTILGDGTWSIDLGYQPKGNNSFVSFFSMRNCIVETSSWSFSPTVESQTDSVYPISGKMTLSIKSQSIFTTSDIPLKLISP